MPDRVLVPSHFLAQKINGYFPFLHKRLRIIPPGIQPLPSTTRKRESGAPLRILYIGILLPHKGVHLLIEALRGLPAGSVTVSLYGAVVPFWQSYADRLRQEAQDLPVRFCGSYHHEQIGSILSQHDVLVMPAVCEETFSLVTREALTAGLPVIAARRGALPEAVQDGVNGLLCEPENVADLQRCLRRMSEDPGLLEQLSSRSTPAQGVTEYARAVEEVYAEIVPHADRGQQKKPGAMTTLLSQEGVLESAGPALVRVSVCLPTYNGEEFIAEALKSILAQSLTDFELLVVDDCSTDTTLDIVRSFADPRIRIYQNAERLGIPGNWNRCLSLARGEYVCLFHQDDVMLPENLERKVRVLDSDPGIGFVHSAAEVLTESSAPTQLGEWIEDATEDFTVEGLIYFRKLLLHGDCICAPAVVTRRTELLRLGGFDGELGYACDYEMWMKMCVESRAAFLCQPLIRYRWHGENASHVFRFERGVEEC
ncbi:MAG: glycosyltransferase, partial [Candidatus Binatia bacterium]